MLTIQYGRQDGGDKNCSPLKMDSKGHKVYKKTKSRFEVHEVPHYN